MCPAAVESPLQGASSSSPDVNVRAHLPASSAVIPSLVRFLPLALALAVLIALAAYQLELPGLHYDEAKEAGLNAMQLLSGQPVTAFRDAAVSIGPWRIPLMVQDYIGNLNVLLALPFLAVGGVDTAALRALPLLLAALTLVLVWKIADRLAGPFAGAAATLLLAVNPSFVFWSRQGIFVTNITVLFFMAALWFGVKWWQERRTIDFVLLALSCGLGIYAKLLFVWAAAALFLVGLAGLLYEWRKTSYSGPSWAAYSPGGKTYAHPKPKSGLSWRTLGLAALAFLLPLTPLILFNLQTGGTVASIFGRLGESYYGVDNRAYGQNLLVRLEQVVTLLRGSHLWYLGAIHDNALVPVLALVTLLMGFAAWWARGHKGFFTPLLPLALLLLIVLQSAFTVSDLFITHFALVTPLAPLAAGLALGEIAAWAGTDRQTSWHRSAVPVALAGLVVLGWAATDGLNTVRYHRALTVSGGFAAHSDAIYRLVEYLDSQGYASPVALDWGIDAPVQFLTAGRVQPVDVFGYDRIDAPDGDFMTRLNPHLDDPQSVYIAHPPDKVIFQGRLEAIAELTTRGAKWLEERRIAQRSGETIYIIHRFFR